PVHVAPKLLDGAGYHWATPDDGISWVGQEHIHRNDLDAGLAHQRRDAFRALFGIARDAKHARDAWPGDVAIQNADLHPLALERDGRQAVTSDLPTPPLP